MAAPDTAGSGPPDGADLGRRERRKLELHGRILEAARELFDVRGFDATRVSEIAERAEGRGLDGPYGYVRWSRDLLSAIDGDEPSGGAGR